MLMDFLVLKSLKYLNYWNFFVFFIDRKYWLWNIHTVFSLHTKNSQTLLLTKIFTKKNSI